MLQSYEFSEIGMSLIIDHSDFEVQRGFKVADLHGRVN